MKRIVVLLLNLILLCACVAVLSPQANAAKLVWPVPGHTSLSRGYIKNSHYGIDITDGSIRGATVVASMGGYVTQKYTCNANHYPNIPSCCYGFGNGVVIKGDDGRYYQYAHMLEGSIPSNVYVGAYVKAGAKVGCVGNTGCSAGNHLHFQIATATPMNNYAIDPKKESYVYSGVLNWYDTVVQSDPGTNFSAYIIKNSTWKHTGHVNNNVELTGNTGKASEVWYFVRQSDKSYVIYNCDNNKVLTVKDSGTANDTNIIVADYVGTDNQKWYIHGRWSGEYVLRSKHSNKVFDVKTNYDSVGTNIHLWEYHGGTAQLFAIYKCDLIGTPELNVEVGNKVKFSWKITQSAGSYTVKVYKGSSVTGTPYLTKTVTGSSCEVELGAGSYSAVLHAQNARASSKSVVRTFTVKGASNNDGWTYANSLPSGVTSKNYTIQYCPVYEKTAKTSPGSGWVQGIVAKQVYENSGSVYYSTLPLTTSDTRALVNYSYYHYCCGSKGEEVNYEFTPTYTHYDGISKDKVYEFYSHADYADSRYTFYGLKYKDTGNYVYCNSNTTCDGSDGKHGNRSYYYYKVYHYQDKVPVNYYKYTKQGDWSNAKDATAVSHTVRYKPLDIKIVKPGATNKISASQTTKTISLSWNKVSDATVYCVFQLVGNEWKILGNVTGTSYRASGLGAGTKYSFAVMAGKTIGGNTVWSDQYKSATFVTKPNVPDGIKASQSSTEITLSWKKVSGANGYRIYQYNSKTKKYEKIKTVKSGATLKYKVKNLKAGTIYKFKVKAYIKVGETNLWSDASGVFTTATDPKKCTLSSVKSSKTKEITVAWKTVSGATSYEVKYSTSKNFTAKTTKTVTIKNSKTTKTTIKKLKKGKKYYVKVRAYKIVGKTKIYGAYSSVKSVKVK